MPTGGAVDDDRQRDGDGMYRTISLLHIGHMPFVRVLDMLKHHLLGREIRRLHRRCQSKQQ